MNILKRITHYLDSRSAFSIVLGMVVLQTILHVKYFGLPPVGFHQWRQTQTLAVARNFYEESVNIFHPRVDGRGQYTGITGMEFPIVSYSIAVAYKIFGFSNAVHRIVILLYSFLALWGCFLFARKIFESQWLGAASAFFLIFSPLFCYYSIVALPDIPALSFIFLALYFFLSYQESGKLSSFILLLVMFTLAALIKVYALVLLLFFAYHIWNTKRSCSSKVISLVGIGCSVMLVGGWYIYARYLSDTYHNYDFRLSSNFPYLLNVVPGVLQKVFLQWLPELYLNYAQFVFFCVGVYILSRGKFVSARRFVLLYLTLFVVYAIMFLPMFEIHDYYAIPALPMLIVLTVVGFAQMLAQSENKGWVRYLTLALLVLVPILGSVRSLSRFESVKQPWDLLTIENHLKQVIPDKHELIIAAGDQSPSIYLYFMHRKGWPIGQTLTEAQLIEMKKNGAKYLVSSSPAINSDDNLEKHFTAISQYGRFQVFALNDTTHKASLNTSK